MKGADMVLLIETIVLFLIIVCAVFVDMRERRIPNKLILVGLLCGVLFVGLQFGDISITDRIGGFFLGIALLFIPFAMRGIGAGDVKLLGLVGLYVGIKTIVSISLISFVVGGGIALIILAIHRLKKFKSLSTVYVSFLNSFMTKKLLLSEEGKLTLPFSIPIAIGTLLVVICKWSIF